MPDYSRTISGYLEHIERVQRVLLLVSVGSLLFWQANYLPVTQVVEELQKLGKLDAKIRTEHLPLWVVSGYKQDIPSVNVEVLNRDRKSTRPAHIANISGCYLSQESLLIHVDSYIKNNINEMKVQDILKAISELQFHVLRVAKITINQTALVKVRDWIQSQSNQIPTKGFNCLATVKEPSSNQVELKYFAFTEPDEVISELKHVELGYGYILIKGHATYTNENKIGQVNILKIYEKFWKAVKFANIHSDIPYKGLLNTATSEAENGLQEANVTVGNIKMPGSILRVALPVIIFLCVFYLRIEISYLSRFVESKKIEIEMNNSILSVWHGSRQGIISSIYTLLAVCALPLLAFFALLHSYTKFGYWTYVFAAIMLIWGIQIMMNRRKLFPVTYNTK